MEEKREKADFNIPDKRKLVDQPAIKKSFMDVLIKMHKKSESEAEAIFEQEAMYFKQLLTATPKLASATGLSLYSTFLYAATNSLSLQPGGKADAFIECRAAETKDKDGKSVYIQVARLVVTVYGELNMRLKSGQILRMFNPIVVYEGDHFKPKTNDKSLLVVDYASAIPRKSNKIIACFVVMALPNGLYDTKMLLVEDLPRLIKYSTPRATSYNPNPQANKLYFSNDGQIDPGFFEAKTMKHAIRTTTRLEVKGNVVLEDDDDEVEDFEAENTEQNNSINSPIDTPPDTSIVDDKEDW